MTSFDFVRQKARKVRNKKARKFRPLALFSTKFGETGYTMVAVNNFDMMVISWEIARRVESSP